MHGFSGRQLQQAAWKQGLADTLGVEIPDSQDNGAQAKQVEAEVAFDQATA